MPRRPSTTVVVATAAIAAGLIAGFDPTSAHAALTAYYTLDDLTTGIQNAGTDGATSDLSAPNAGATPTAVAGGMRGGALVFDGNDILRSITPGNAADDLAAYPFTQSVWMRNVVVDVTRDAAFGLSERANGSRYYVTGSQGVGARQEPEIVRRNTTFTETNATGADVSGATWTNVVSVFGPTNAEIYVNGKLAGSAAIGQTFDAAVDTIAVGGFLRNGSTTTPTDAFSGQADEIGLFDTGLVASDVALINGLGKTGGIGLDQLDEAQSLLAMAVGTSGTIGGVQWERASGLAGTAGDFGGTVAGGNAFIVTDAAGNGIQQVVPEPSGLALAGLAGAALLRRRSRR